MNGHQEKALEYLENLRSDISENFLVLAKMLARHLEVLLDTGIDQEDQVCLADSEITEENILCCRVNRESASKLFSKLDDIFNLENTDAMKSFEDFMRTISSQEVEQFREYSKFSEMLDFLKKDKRAREAQKAIWLI